LAPARERRAAISQTAQWGLNVHGQWQYERKWPDRSNAWRPLPEGVAAEDDPRPREPLHRLVRRMHEESIARGEPEDAVDPWPFNEPDDELLSPSERMVRRPPFLPSARAAAYGAMHEG
jgi:hypothetical protein